MPCAQLFAVTRIAFKDFKDYNEIRCIALGVSQTSKANVEGKRRRDFGFFCSVDHLSEGGVNANHNITCSPSLAENDSRLFKNSEGNLDGQWIFDEGKRETLLYSCS